MRIVTNRQRVNRSRQIAQYLFFASLAILFGGLIFTNTIGQQNSTLLFLPCAIMPLGLVTTLVSVRLTNQWVRLPHPEDAIRDGLKGINKRSILYNYVLGPNHVLITPQGVFSLTTRFHESRFSVEGENWINWKGRGPLSPVMLFLRQEHLGDPFKDARQDAEAVQPLVDKALPGAGIKVQPVVVFTSPKATLEVTDPAIPVVYADTKKKPSLRSALRDSKAGDDSQDEDSGAISPKKRTKGMKPKQVAQKDDIKAKLSPEQIEALDDAFLNTIDEKKFEKQIEEDEA